MSGAIPPIPPPFGASFGNPSNPNANRVDTMPTTIDPINTTTIENVAQSVVDENLPQLLDSRGGSHVINVLAFNKKDFTSWKVRFLVFLDGLEPYLLKTLEDGPFIPMSKDERTTKIRAFIAIAEDEPSVGKADARSGQWIDITMKKADVSISESAPMITSDLEDDSDIQEPMPSLSKLTEADPSIASKSLISLSDLTAYMADLTLNTASKEIKNIIKYIYATGLENRPPMLNKENYVPWSSRLLRYAKSRPNGKLIHNSIINGPCVSRMIPEPGDPNREVPVNETFHVQTDDELTEKELKQIEFDDQAIQIILLDLPEDIYAVVDSCETAQEIWLRVPQMMKGSDIGIQEKKAKLFNEREMFTSTDEESIESYYHHPTTAMNIALALMAKAFKLNYSTPTNNNQRISSNPRNRQIAQPGMNMGQDRQMQMVGGNSENQFIQYAGQNVGNLNGYNAVENVKNENPNGNGNLIAARAEGNAPGHNGNQIRCYNCRGLGHFSRNCIVRLRRRDAAYLQTQLLIAQKEEAGIQLQAEEFDLMAAAANLDEIEKVNADYILMANLQQASTSGTQTDKAPVYDLDGSTEVHNYENCYDNEIFNMFTQEEQYTELFEPNPETYQVPQNDNDVISEITSVEQSGGTVEQHPANVEETRVLYDSLYNNLAIKVEKVNTVNRKLRETNAELTIELARYKNQEKCFEISQEKYDKLERCYQKSVYQE
nr:hypothetical protein [Tanacetum cinerariifolium]